HAHACGAESHVIEFTQIASGKVPMAAFLGADCGTDAVLRVRKANPGNKTETGRALPAVTLAQRLRDSRVRRVLHRLRLNLLPGWRAMALRMGGVAVQP